MLAFVVVLTLFTVWISWRASVLASRLTGEAETSDLVGKSAPSLNLTTLDGQDISLADLRKTHNVIVAFWASWCVPCRIEMALLKRFYNTARKTHDDLEVVAVSIDEDRAAAANYAATAKLPFRVLVDTSQRVANAWHVGVIPLLFIVDKNGKVAFAHVGEESALDVVLAGELSLTDYKPEFQMPDAKRGN
jgi:peroxiredoxin